MSVKTRYRLRDFACPCGHKAQLLLSDAEVQEERPCPECGGAEFKMVRRVTNKVCGYIEDPLMTMEHKFGSNPTWDGPAAKHWFNMTKRGKKGINVP